jgi:hypothetical protein
MRFRAILRPGDALPDEIVDGRPSWSAKPRRLARAVRRLAAAIGAPGAADADEAHLADAFDDLARVVHGRGFVDEARLGANDIAQVAGDAARVDWLCGAVVAVQQCLGALARTAAARQASPHADAARAAARGLRDAVVWASARAMAADQIVADPARAFSDVAAFRARLWPLIASLRAFALDIEPLMTQWEAARARRGGPGAQDFDALLRVVSVRYSDFDPLMFDLDRIRMGLPGAGAGTGHRWGFEDAE